MKCASCGVEYNEEADACPACGATVGGGYLDRGPAIGSFGRMWMYLSWAVRWLFLMVFGLLFGVIMLGASVSAESSDSGLFGALGLMFLCLGLFGAYVTYLNFRKKKGV